MLNKITAITLGVKDLNRATEFYVNGLNMPKMEWEGDITFIKLDNLILSRKRGHPQFKAKNTISGFNLSK
jgi:hypothetical protein